MLKDKTIVITGGSSGIGAAAARALAAQGAKVIITGRSPSTQVIASELGCEHFLVDFTRLKEVKEFARNLIDRYPRIDALVNNVGGVIADRRMTEDGHEQTFQVNHLSGFLLTLLLKERLEQSQGVVINTASAANLIGKIRFDDLENSQGYNSMRAYGTAKLMNILHAMEIGRRFKNVTSASFHPGVVATGFAREGGTLARFLYESPLKNLFMISPEKGADTLLWLLQTESGKDWHSGEFYQKRRPGRKNTQATVENAVRLWEASEGILKSVMT